tara:strand:- start:318 stop:500 length:183 start_codon:yes stop_codon:yes gene_type:complete
VVGIRGSTQEANMGKRNHKHGVKKINTYAKSLQKSKYRQRVVLDKKNKYKRNNKSEMIDE